MHDVVHSKRIFDRSLILVYWFGCIDSSFNIFSLDRRISKVDKRSTNSNPILCTRSHISLYVSANIVGVLGIFFCKCLEAIILQATMGYWRRYSLTLANCGLRRYISIYFDKFLILNYMLQFFSGVSFPQAVLD